MSIILKPESTDRTANFSFSLLPEHQVIVRRIAESKRVSRSEVVRRALEELSRNNT